MLPELLSPGEVGAEQTAGITDGDDATVTGDSLATGGGATDVEGLLPEGLALFLDLTGLTAFGWSSLAVVPGL